MLNINHTTFPSLHVESNQQFSPEKESDKLQLKVNVEHKVQVENEFSMFITVSFYNEEDLNVPCQFDISCVGNFSVEDSDLKCVNKKAFYLRNAAGVLFASIREMLAMMTARSPFGSILLPSYYFTFEQFLTEEEMEKLD